MVVWCFLDTKLVHCTDFMTARLNACKQKCKSAGAMLDFFGAREYCNPALQRVLHVVIQCGVRWSGLVSCRNDHRCHHDKTGFKMTSTVHACMIRSGSARFLWFFPQMKIHINSTKCTQTVQHLYSISWSVINWKRLQLYQCQASDIHYSLVMSSWFCWIK